MDTLNRTPAAYLALGLAAAVGWQWGAHLVNGAVWVGAVYAALLGGLA